KLTENRSRTSARVGAAILISAAVILLATGAIASAYSLNAEPVIVTNQNSAKQEQALKEKAERDKELVRVVMKDGVAYAYRVEIPAELKPVIGTWKGSHEFVPAESEVSRSNPIRNPDVKLVHSDVQITVGYEGGQLTATYMTYQKITRTNGEESFQMNQFELRNPQFDGNTITTATEGQQRENEMEAKRTGTPGTRYFKIRLTGDGQAEAWMGEHEEETPHIQLKLETPKDEPRGKSKEERRK
ncbi:MAG TPA: hypothetical protein VEZ90_18135, partial [Blastocatellia bacterium]|nr:hypothetical protein [Blastocatellia bacterium]